MEKRNSIFTIGKICSRNKEEGTERVQRNTMDSLYSFSALSGCVKTMKGVWYDKTER